MVNYCCFAGKCIFHGSFSMVLIHFRKYTFLFFFSIITICFSVGNDSVLIAQETTHAELTHDEIKKGERLFYGLIKTGENTISCAQCHYFFQGDSVNWNPSAYDIAATVSENGVNLKDVLLNPSGKRMTDAHSNIKLSDDQIKFIHGYLQELHKKGATPSKPKVNNLIIFIFLLIINVLAIVLLILKKYPKLKILYSLVIIITGIFLTKYIVDSAIDIGRSPNYEPDQPIKFSHKVHVDQNKIDCKYCHSTVEYSKTASIPSANVCMNCHVLVREGTRTGKFEINKIIKAVEKNQPIEWIQVHNLPDHVFFSHAQHVGVGKLDCNACHGDVGNMNRVKQVSDLSMGWCVNCHRDSKVQFTDNAFYSKYEALHKQLKEGKIKAVTVENVGGIECMKCHY